MAEGPGPKKARAFLRSALLLCNHAAFADTIVGRVVGITDGDTITVLDSNKGQHKIRLAGIDAPEKKQPFFEASRQNLASSSLLPLGWYLRQRLERLLSPLKDVSKSPAGSKVDIRAFSDSIVLSTALTNAGVADLIEAVIELQRIFVSKHVLIRGAVAMGKHFASPELVYSEALVRAFRLERDTARFPRVVVDSNLLDWFLNDADTDAGLGSRVTNVLLRDRDNNRFISYLHGPLLAAHAALLKTYELDRITPSVLEKVQWLAEYHNHIAMGIDKTQTVNTPLLAGFRSFA